MALLGQGASLICGRTGSALRCALGALLLGQVSDGSVAAGAAIAHGRSSLRTAASVPLSARLVCCGNPPSAHCILAKDNPLARPGTASP